MNSFRSVERAIAFEIERQAAALDAGEPLVQETRGWADDRGATYRMRVKETSDDYRYFPEPDLPPLHLDAGLARRRSEPACRSCRRRAGRATATTLGLSATTRRCSSPIRTRRRCSRRRSPPTRRSSRSPSRTGSPASTCGLRNAAGPRRVARRARRARPRSSARSRRGRSRARKAARCSRRTSRRARRPPRSSRRAGFRQISDAGALGAAVDDVLAANPAAVADYRAGKAQAVGFLVGQVMKATRGQANAALVQDAVASGSTDRDRGGLIGGAVEHRAVGRRRRPDRRSATRGRAARGRATRRSRPRTPTSPATSRGAAASANDGATGASVAMAVLRRQAQIGGAIAIVGVVLVFLGFLIR